MRKSYVIGISEKEAATLDMLAEHTNRPADEIVGQLLRCRMLNLMVTYADG